MADITESSTWEPVRQWEITDPAIGGTSGVMNTPLKSLVNRTKYLKTLVENIIAGAQNIVGALQNGSTIANTFYLQQHDTAVASAEFVQNSIAAATGRRNMILNGDMRIAQRGTSFDLTTDGLHWILDRWIVELAGRDCEFGQDGDTHRADIFNASHCLRIKLKTGTGTIGIKQRIENVWTFAGGKCVIQFAMKAPVAFDFTVNIKQYLSHDSLVAQTPRWSDSEALRAETTFTRHYVIFDVPSFADILGTAYDSSNCVEISIETADTRAIDFWITQVQVESGIIPTNFEVRDDWNDCLRYFEKNVCHEQYNDKQNISDEASRWSIFRRQYYHRKRITPTITKENITYTLLDSVSNLTDIEQNSCTLEIKPANGGVIASRELQMDMLINAEIE